MDPVLLLILAGGLVLLYRSHRSMAERIERLERQLWEAEASRSHIEKQPRPAPAPDAEPWLPPPVREPNPSDEPPSPPPAGETLATLIERFVAGRMLIWVGGISLAVAGIFLVRYSIEIGLVTPPVRMLIAAGFGLMLVAAGEAARARNAAGDPRVAQALVGAGIFVLYAAIYGSLTLYGLIGLGTAALLMGLVTVAALGLSLRHGAPTAVLGLTGGFLTPLLVGDPDASPVPLLAYLALLNTALFALAQRRGWTWLAAGAVALSFVWTAVLLIEPDANDALAGGVFIVALGIAASIARPGGGRTLGLMQPAAIGLVQLALLVGRQDVGITAWALFGILAAACLFLSARARAFRLLPPLALLIALLLLAADAARGAEPMISLVAAAITILFGGFAVTRLGREDRVLWSLIATAAVAAPAIILRTAQPELLPAATWGAMMAALAGGTAALYWRGRGFAVGEGHYDWALAGAAATSLLLLAFASYDLLPRNWVPVGWLALAIGAAWVSQLFSEKGAGLSAAALAAAAIMLAATLVPQLWLEAVASLFGEPALASRLPPPVRAILLLLVPGALLFVLTRLLTLVEPEHRRALAVAAIIFVLGGLYIPVKQIFGLSDETSFASRGFAERTLITQALFVTGWLLIRSGRDGLRAAGAFLGGLAAFRFVWFELVVHNPAATPQWVGEIPVLNLLLPAFLGTAAWAHLARRRSENGSGLWLALFLAALIAGVMLIVRQAFQGAFLSGTYMPRGEFYGYSLAGLLLSIALLIAGIRLADKALRVAGLALLTATILKVFLVDAAELEGVLRILSFLGLGIALIGVGKLYAKVLNAEAAPAGP